MDQNLEYQTTNFLHVDYVISPYTSQIHKRLRQYKNWDEMFQA